MKKYSAFAFKVGAIVVPVVVLFVLLDLCGFTPLYTNSISFDAKIKYAKEKEVGQIDLMAIGSSVTLNDLSSAVIKDSLGVSYFNFSSWGLQMRDVHALTTHYIPKYHPKYVIVISSITDFANNDLSETIDNYLNTGQYFKDHLEAYFYIKNFNSIEELRNRKKGLVEDMSIDTNYYNSLHYDEGGAVLLNIPKARILARRWNDRLPFPTKYTPSQYQALDSLSANLRNHNIKFIFVQAPIKDQYVDNPGAQKAVNDHIARCKDIIEKNSGTYLNFEGDKEFSNDSLFVDQFHLSAKGAAVFTKKVTHSLKGVYFKSK
jgi:hypothetical protein